MSLVDKVAENFKEYLDIVKSIDTKQVSVSTIFSSMRSMGDLYKQYCDINSIAEGEFDLYEDELSTILKGQERVISYLK